MICLVDSARKQLANYPIPGIFSERNASPKQLCQGSNRLECLKSILYAGDVNDDHVAVRVIVLVLSRQVGVEERSVELICHDDFVVDCLRSQKSGHLTP